MKEAALPLLGILLVFGLILPASALLAKGVFKLLDGRDAHGGLHGYPALRYALLVAPTALPLGWFVSACLHQAEAGTEPGVCTSPDAPGVLCPEVAFFAAAIVLLVALAALPRLVREQRALRVAASPGARREQARVLALMANHPELNDLRRRLVVSSALADAIVTRGVFSPRIVVDAAFVEHLDDAALIGALRHEAEHVRARDPLRYFIAWWALAANPLGRLLLERELARWIAVRETHCDREAVLAGASAPALAQALVLAARFPALNACAAALAPADGGLLRLRIDLLMAYADRAPRCCCRGHALRLALCALLFAAALPHQFGTDALDSLHRAADGAAFQLFGN